MYINYNSESIAVECSWYDKCLIFHSVCEERKWAVFLVHVVWRMGASLSIQLMPSIRITCHCIRNKSLREITSM